MPDRSAENDCLVPPAIRECLESLLAFLAEPHQPLPDSIGQSRDLARSWLDAITGQKRFVELGRICATPGALTRIPSEEIIFAIARHQSGDWGNVDADDWQENDRSLRDSYRLVSAYVSTAGTRFWIITEADRSVTTALLPDEY